VLDQAKIKSTMHPCQRHGMTFETERGGAITLSGNTLHPTLSVENGYTFVINSKTRGTT
jgi:hypothetical protein